MIIQNTGLEGLKSDLAHLDRVTAKLGFVRWQWEYYRATYDYKYEVTPYEVEYFLRINARAVEGKLESADTILELEGVYVGLATFPHGLDYNSPVPGNILKSAKQKLADLRNLVLE